VNAPPEGDLSAQLVKERSVPTETRKRLSPYLFEAVPTARQSDYEAQGWVQDRKLKRSVVMRRLKPGDELFVDRVWAAFSRLQFPMLNKEKSFSVTSVLTASSQSNGGTSFDVFAADEEIALIVVCRSAETPAASSFRQEIETIQARRAEVLRSLRTWIPDTKIKFILATNNFILSEATLDRLRESDIVHMDEDTIDYYLELADHLGPAARYQLLGSLFAGTKIPGLESRVAAIQGKMGGHTYYSFMIEPARLLKLGYILHRHKATSELMPTYQRIIKKSRLKSIAHFVDNGGYFPNSIIVNIEAGARGLHFDRAATTADTDARVGVLHLPQTYRAAYIIDGQHRLYGYAGSHRAETDLVPVVAFSSLPRADQVELFMQINENQQAVPKNLRNTLNAELLYESSDVREQTKALKLRIAQQLAEHKASPLRGRIVIGEEKANALRCITIDSISLGLDRGNFIGSSTKAAMKEPGTFYRGGNEPTRKILFPFLELSFAYLRDHLQAQWDLGKADGGFVFVNNGIEAFLRILSDIVDHLVALGEVNPRTDATEEVFAKVQLYLDPLVGFLGGISYAAAAEFRRMYGSAGRARYWRKLQAAINSAIPEFDPPGLTEFHEDENTAFNTEAYRMINEIESFLKSDVRRKLEDYFGQAWAKQGIPLQVYKDASTLAIEKNYDKREEAEDAEPWDCMHLINYLQILQKNFKNWEAIFQERYTRPGDKSGSWKDKAAWLQDLNRIRNKVSHAGTPVTQQEYNFVVAIHTWLGLHNEQ
jgi:DNA sulfur modification protein DndB